MKKYLCIILILALPLGGVCGCQTLKNAFCSPTVEAVLVAAEKLAEAESMLAYLENQYASPEVSAAKAALKIAMPILRQVKDGICVDAADQRNAEAAVVNTAPLTQKLGYKRL